jgi:hypothetical protein
MRFAAFITSCPSSLGFSVPSVVQSHSTSFVRFAVAQKSPAEAGLQMEHAKDRYSILM